MIETQKEVREMPRLEISREQIEKLISQLGERERIQLVKKLEQKTLPARWRSFLREIDQRRRRSSLTESQIQKIVEEVRQDVYEGNRR